MNHELIHDVSYHLDRLGSVLYTICDFVCTKINYTLQLLLCSSNYCYHYIKEKKIDPFKHLKCLELVLFIGSTNTRDNIAV